MAAKAKGCLGRACASAETMAVDVLGLATFALLLVAAGIWIKNPPADHARYWPTLVGFFPLTWIWSVDRPPHARPPSFGLAYLPTTTLPEVARALGATPWPVPASPSPFVFIPFPCILPLPPLWGAMTRHRPF